MESIGTKTIETQRLILRKFTMADAEDMYNNWAGSDEVTRFLTWPTHSCIEVSRDILESWVMNYDDGDYYQWCIELKESREAIGSIGVVNLMKSIATVEIGYCIGQKYWNQGITAEALTALVRFFFEEVGVNRIEAKHDVNNQASGRVMQKCGLKYEGTKIQADRNNTGICDVSLYGMTSDDYHKLRA